MGLSPRRPRGPISREHRGLRDAGPRTRHVIDPRPESETGLAADTPKPFQCMSFHIRQRFGEPACAAGTRTGELSRSDRVSARKSGGTRMPCRQSLRTSSVHVVPGPGAPPWIVRISKVCVVGRSIGPAVLADINRQERRHGNLRGKAAQSPAGSACGNRSHGAAGVAARARLRSRRRQSTGSGPADRP